MSAQDKQSQGVDPNLPLSVQFCSLRLFIRGFTKVDPSPGSNRCITDELLRNRPRYGRTAADLASSLAMNCSMERSRMGR